MQLYHLFLLALLCLAMPHPCQVMPTPQPLNSTSNLNIKHKTEAKTRRLAMGIEPITRINGSFQSRLQSHALDELVTAFCALPGFISTIAKPIFKKGTNITKIAGG
jgi:hypothetical protein